MAKKSQIFPLFEKWPKKALGKLFKILKKDLKQGFPTDKLCWNNFACVQKI